MSNFSELFVRRVNPQNRLTRQTIACSSLLVHRLVSKKNLECIMVRIVKNTSISSKLPTSTTRHHLNAKKYPLQSFWPRDRFPTLLRFWTTTSTLAAKYILDTALNNPFSNPSHVA